MERKPQAVENARVHWDAYGSPVSEAFQEAYFSTRDPLRERTEVFLRGNNLPQAWSEGSSFCIGEMGFGFGLSFLLTWKLWKETRPKNGHLHFVSLESTPVRVEDLRRAHARWPELSELGRQLYDAYPPPVLGVHRRSFDDSLDLTLVIGTAPDALDELDFEANAWYLDGFSPAKNPELWTVQLARKIRQHSVPGAHLASYSVARSFRDAFDAEGWKLTKLPGTPPKREMIIGELAPRDSQTPVARVKGSPQSDSRALVIGGGIAGSAMAYALAKRGLAVTILERNESLASEASGNPAGIFMPHVSLDPDPISRFAIRGYLHACETVRNLTHRFPVSPYSACGVLRLASSDRLRTLWASLSGTGLDACSFVTRVSSEETKDVCGVASPLPGLFFPAGGWISPRVFTQQGVESSNRIQSLVHSGVRELRRASEVWQAVAHDGSVLGEGDVAIICNAHDSLHFEQCSWFPLESVRGQLITQRRTEASSAIRSVICYDGYILPEHEGMHVIGATYDHGDQRREVDDSQSRTLLSRVTDALPALDFSESGILDSRVSFRAMSRDRLPLVCAVPKLESYSGLTSWREEFRPEFYPQLYVSVGHGSRGLITAHLSAEILASEIFGEPSALEQDLREHLLVERYLTRLLKRGVAVTPETASSFRVLYPPKATVETTRPVKS